MLTRTVFRYSHVFYLFPLLARILSFFGTHINGTLFRNSPEQFSDTRTNSAFSRYSHEFDYFSVITLIGSFSGTHPKSFSILARILPFPGTRPESTIFRFSPEQFFDIRMDSTFFQYSHGFEHFSVLTQIGPFSGTLPNCFSILAQILPDRALARILSFFSTHTDWTLFWYSPEQFFDIRMNSTFFRYSHGFHHFSVLRLIGPFSGTHPNSFSILAQILLFLGTHPDSNIFRYS